MEPGPETETPRPRSRRERPAKPALSREAIVAAALEIVRSEGLRKLTMRRIAAALDTGAASLYVYIRDMGELHVLLLDAHLTALETARREGEGWREQVHRVLWEYLTILGTYPEMTRTAMFARPDGPHYLRLVDSILGGLLDGGIAPRDAARGVDLLLLYTSSFAVERAMREAAGDEDVQAGHLRTTIAGLDPAGYPHIVAVGADALMEPGPRFPWGVDVILDGMQRA